MSPVVANPPWVTRLLRIASSLSVGAAIVIWLAPVNALGRNLVPVGCGSPAAPALDPLSDYVCRDIVGAAKGVSLALVLAAALFLLVSEAVLPRYQFRRWVPGVAMAAVVAVPAFAIAALGLSSTVAASGADGTLIRCGSPLQPATDAISNRMCGQLPERDRTLSLGVMGLSLLAMVGAGYISSAVGSDKQTLADLSEAEVQSDSPRAPGPTQTETEHP